MSVEKMLCLSTAHITQQQSEELAERVALDIEGQKPGDWTDGFIVYPHGAYGWLLPIGGIEREDLVQDGIDGNIMAIFDQAIAEQCDWILIDQDAELIEGLPEFDW
jgi:hypothetical protein